MDTIFLDDFSREVWETTYRHKDEKTVNDTLRRVAKAVASVENTSELRSEWEKKFYKTLSGFKVTTGGRILANAGTDYKGVTLMNCFVGPKPSYDQDSIEGIFSVLTSQVLTLKSEGGWGMNFSFIRPRGSFIYGIGVETPGAVKYMELFNTSSDVITAGSGKKKAKKEIEGKIKIRKGAMMGVLDVWHGDIEEFITAKLQEGRLNKFNLSVNCSNEFMDRLLLIREFKRIIATKEYSQLQGYDESHYLQRIEELDKWDLIFPDTKYPKYKEEWDGNIYGWKAKGYPIKVIKTVSLTALWSLIMQSTYDRNDPGVLFLDRANETHCYSYGKGTHIAATNPCGEQCLPFGFVCNLGSINLTQFVKEDGTFDFTGFASYVGWTVRLLDNVNDLSGAPLAEYARSIKEARRIGLGVMGWGSLLYMLKIRFASSDAEALKDRIMKVLTTNAIEASIDLAREKGQFTGCKPELHADSKFFKNLNLDPFVLEKMRRYGIRNSSLFSCQPTGNTGVVANIVSGGIEPVFLAEYIRTVIIDGCPTDMVDIVPKYWEGEFKETDVFKWVHEGEDKILRGTFNGVVYKIDKNRGLTKEVPCIDYGVRWLRQHGQWDPKAKYLVTASDLTVEEHLTDMKGFAKWVDSSISKTVNLPNDYPFEDFKNLYLDAYKSGVLKGITTYRAGTMMNVMAAQKSKTLPKTHAPKRPTELQGKIFTLNYKKDKLYVAIGFWEDGSPYEVFTGNNWRHKIEKAEGRIIKMARSKYKFVANDNVEYDLTNGHSDESADVLCRVLSASLRHGCDIAFLVHQLEKSEGDLQSFSKVIARVLKKFIKEGTKVSGEECPECKSFLIRAEGCSKCISCSYSKCN